MNTMIDQMLEAYDTATLEEKRNALREISQEVILCGLSRGGFFSKAAFYGGTALRVFHGLDRFSEDMDFSLKQPDASFSLEDYLPAVERECSAWGFHFEATMKRKSRDSAIQPAFCKANTQEHLVMLFPQDGAVTAIPSGELLRIKVEVDVDPAPYASFDQVYRLLPSPYEASLYDLPSLFAGKIHAVLCRSWKNRVKGRDLYDYVFYRSKGASVNVDHLRAKLIQTGHLDENQRLLPTDVEAMLCERFDAIDFAQAKSDIAPFLRDPGVLGVWSPDFFKAITRSIEGIFSD